MSRPGPRSGKCRSDTTVGGIRSGMAERATLNGVPTRSKRHAQSSCAPGASDRHAEAVEHCGGYRFYEAQRPRSMRDWGFLPLSLLSRTGFSRRKSALGSAEPHRQSSMLRCTSALSNRQKPVGTAGAYWVSPPSPRFDPFGTLKRDRRGGSVLAQHFAEKPTLPPGEPDRHIEARRQSADVTMHRGPIHERFATINIVMPEFDPVRIGARIKKRTQRRHAILSAAERHDNPCVLVEIRHHDRNLAADAPVMIRRLLSAPGTGVIESAAASGGVRPTSTARRVIEFLPLPHLCPRRRSLHVFSATGPG